MYRILVVDDEPIHRREMVNMIRSLRNSYEVAEAANGLNALEILNNEEFNIIITDVKMPLMDGLQLIEALDKRVNRIKVVILSGYDYFDYAKRALKLGACDYLLKPVDEDTIEAMLRRVEELLEIQMAGDKTREKLQEQLSIAYPVYVDNAMNKWINGELSEDEAKKLGGVFENKGYCRFILLQVSCLEANTDYNNTSNINEEMKSYLRDNVFNHLEQFGHKLSFFIENKSLIIAGSITSLECEDNDYTNRLEHQLKQLAAIIYEERHIKIKTGVSSAHNCMFSQFDANAEAYRQAYTEAVNALEYGFYKTRAVNFYSENEVIPGMNTLEISSSLETKIKNAVMSNDKNIAGEVIRNELRRVIENGKPIPDKIRSYAEELIFTFMNSVFHTLGKMHCSELTAKIKQTLATCIDYMELVKLSEYFVSDIFEAAEVISKSKSSYIVQKCVNYINEHLHEDLNVEVLADKFHFNVSYFSTIFKKNMGIGLSDYITDTRMQKAAQLLSLNNEKVYKIARKVGFCDVKYFYKIFRKKFGVTPNHYRKFSEVNINNKQGAFVDED
jgi:two-component system response regulator YesN